MVVAGTGRLFRRCRGEAHRGLGAEQHLPRTGAVTERVGPELEEL